MILLITIGSISIARHRMLRSHCQRLKDVFEFLDRIVKVVVINDSTDRSAKQLTGVMRESIHQIRGSLTTVTNNMKYLSLETNFSGELNDAFIDIQRSLNDVVSQLGTISALIKNHKRSFLLSPVLAELKNEEIVQLEEMTEEFEVEIEAQLLLEILKQLIKNAKQEGATKLHIKVCTLADQVRLRMWDDGPGWFLSHREYERESWLVQNWYRHSLYSCKQILQSTGGSFQLGISEFGGAAIDIDLAGKLAPGVVPCVCERSGNIHT
jgi:K+-sensing histidine kinase KdpD